MAREIIFAEAMMSFDLTVTQQGIKHSVSESDAGCRDTPRTCRVCRLGAACFVIGGPRRRRVVCVQYQECNF